MKISSCLSSHDHHHNQHTYWPKDDNHSRMSADQVISRLQLIPLPKEGGWFRELRHVQTDGMPALPQDQGAVGDLVEGSSSIYYLVRGTEGSAWHKLSVDEYWCYHSGENIRYGLVIS